jgi:hypothetical protein
MRKRKIIIVVLLVLLLGGAGVMFLSCDSGTPVRVYGELSAKDVDQIKSVVRRHLWRDAFPEFSMQTFKALPGAAKRIWTTHITTIQGNPHVAIVSFSRSVGRTNIVNGCTFTNGPAGWVWRDTWYFSPN